MRFGNLIADESLAYRVVATVEIQFEGELMSDQRTPVLLKYYSAYLDDLNSATYIASVTQSYYPATLERLAEHGSVHQRRAAILAITFVGDYNCNTTMGRALWDPDRGVRMIAEDGISEIWLREGTEATQIALRRLSSLNCAQRYDDAIELAKQIIDESPSVAESHHQLASAHFMMDDFPATLGAAAQAVELNPYHFPALSMMGKSYLQLGQTTLALGCFERALRLNPNREDYRVHISRLRRSST
jgi:tetratricopeptide (TPR) repeat protein